MGGVTGAGGCGLVATGNYLQQQKNKFLLAKIANLFVCAYKCIMLQDLLSVEARLDAEYGCEEEEEGERDRGFEEGILFCPACNKHFKSDKA